MIKHNLIAKYLDIIKEQDNLIRELSESNRILANRNTIEFNDKKKYIKTAIHWKGIVDNLTKYIKELNSEIKQLKRANNEAIRAYKENRYFN